MDTARSQESTSRVIAALSGFGDWKDVLNIPNRGQVAQLPRDIIVETMGMVTRGAVCGLPVGDVPPGILTQIQHHANNQEMTVEAALKGDRGLTLQVMLNDPLCGSIRDFRLMSKMMDELLTANRRWLPQFFAEKSGHNTI